MVYEIQKQFLIFFDHCSLEKLQNDAVFFKIIEFEIFYTKITPNKSIKFKNFNNEFLKITKFNNSVLERNQEEKISRKQYKKARKKMIIKSLIKRRFEFKFCSFKACIDIYKDSQISVLTIFFPTLDIANNFIIPSEFNIQKELYYNLDSKIMILYDFNCQEFNIEKCFKIIEKNQNFTLDFPSYISKYDGFRVFLFYLFKKLKFYWSLYLDTKDKTNFYKFLLYTKELFIILSSMNTILDQNLSNNLVFKFKDLFQKSQNFNKDLNELLKFLDSEEVQDLFSDFDFFIKESFFYKGEDKNIFFKQSIALELRRKIVLVRKHLLKNSEFEIFEESFFELRIFLKYFCNFFRIKKIDKLYKKYFENKDENITIKIIKKKNKFCKLLKKISKILKIYKG